MAQTSMADVTKAGLEWENLLVCSRCTWYGLSRQDADDMVSLIFNGGYVGHVKKEDGRYRVSLGLRIGKVINLPADKRGDWLLTEWVKVCPKCDRMFKEPKSVRYIEPTLAEWEL